MTCSLVDDWFATQSVCDFLWQLIVRLQPTPRGHIPGKIFNTLRNCTYFDRIPDKLLFALFLVRRDSWHLIGQLHSHIMTWPSLGDCCHPWWCDLFIGGCFVRINTPPTVYLILDRSSWEVDQLAAFCINYVKWSLAGDWSSTVSSGILHDHWVVIGRLKVTWPDLTGDQSVTLPLPGGRDPPHWLERLQLLRGWRQQVQKQAGSRFWIRIGSRVKDVGGGGEGNGRRGERKRTET
jgi:hypothetical protein